MTLKRQKESETHSIHRCSCVTHSFERRGEIQSKWDFACLKTRRCNFLEGVFNPIGTKTVERINKKIL